MSQHSDVEFKLWNLPVGASGLLNGQNVLVKQVHL